MSNLKRLIVILLIASSSLIAQYDEFPFYVQNIERYVNGNITYYSTFDEGLDLSHAYAGKQDDYDYEENTFRMIYSWDLSSIPSDAIVSKCTLLVAGTLTSNAPDDQYYVEFIIKEFPKDKFGSFAEEQWAAIENTQQLETLQPFRSMAIFDNELVYENGSSFANYIQSGVSQGRVHLAIRGSDENWNNSATIHVVDFKTPNISISQALKLKIEYTIPQPTSVNFTADNNFLDNTGNGTRGKMKVDGSEITIPSNGYQITKTVGENTSLEAVSSQVDNQDYQRIWYAGSINSSEWTRNGVFKSPTKQYNFETIAEDDGKRYQANLRKNYKIDVNHHTEFDGTQTDQSTVYIVEQNSGQISTPAQKTIGSNTYNFAGWNDGNGSNLRTIMPDDNTDYTALYKVKGKSNDPDAFTNSSQRKFVRSQDGRLHYVYESMGKVWYEMSTDNGSTWQLMNEGKPLSPEDAKLPSITLIHSNRIGIAFQEFSGITVQIIDYYNDVIQEEYTTGIGSTYPLDYSVDLNPVISYNVNNRILVIWQVPTLVPPFGWDTGLYYSLGKFLSLQGYADLEWMEEEIKIAGTDGNSITPTLATRFAKYETDFHLAWEQNGKIKYCRMNKDGAGSLTFSPITTPSDGAGYSGYHSPSIIATDDNKPRLTWLTGNIAFYRTMNSSGSWSTIYSYHGWDQADNISINKTGDDEFAFAFSDMFGEFNNYVNSRNLSSYSRLNTTGKYLQVCNGNSSDTEVKAIVYKNNTFSQSNPLFSSNQEEGSDPPLAKINSSVPVVSGRQITLRNGERELYYNLSDLFTETDTIKFAEMSDSVLISSGNIASYLVTEPFNTKENGSVYLSVNYGSNDSLVGPSAFTENEEIKFTTELIDEEGKILKVVDEVAFNSEAEKYLGFGNYQLQLSGVKGKTARLRIKAESSFQAELAVCNNFTFKDNLEKKNYIQTELLKTEVVKEYSINQNFPNPFNPSTTITFALPQKGEVVLKVYNSLGQEVKTLVNDFKEKGIHKVNFDASDLSSGVYIYSIQANDFYQSKKMILLK